MNAPQILQQSRFEKGYLSRSLGDVAQVPDVAIMELVANAWDAGAVRVNIQIPEEEHGTISVSDDGVGISPALFDERWMWQGYKRMEHQGEWAEFPPERSGIRRRAYGHSGIGRHAMFCFNDTYIVESRHYSEKQGHRFTIRASSGDSLFNLLEMAPTDQAQHGTTISTVVQYNSPVVQKIRDTLSFRFLHDPQFEIIVNGAAIKLEMHDEVDREVIQVDEDTVVEIVCVQVPQARRRKSQHGVAFWVGNRLVGDPIYSLFDTPLVDGRTAVANRYMIVAKTNDLVNEVKEDWSGFRRTPRTLQVADEIAAYVRKLARRVMARKIEVTKRDALRENKSDLVKLSTLGKVEVEEFVNQFTTEYPSVRPDVLSAAIGATINLQKSRSGQALLEKLSAISDEDIDRL